MPTVPKEAVLGVRVPKLRAFSKKVYKTKEGEEFIKNLPHKYYEENNLHALLIEKETDYEKLISYLNEFLPYVNNWATCDLISPKIFKSNKESLIKDIKRWLKSKNTYEVRFGIKCLMTYYLDEDFNPKYFSLVINIKSQEYYINMMRAWYFATALAKKYDETLPILEKHLLDDFTHKKTIQKARESYRIEKSKKEYLKTLV